MGFKLDYQEQNKSTLDVFLSSIVKDSEVTEKEMLKDASETIRKFVIANLNKHRRSLAVRYKGRPAMADDVKISVRTSKYGEKYARVMGGKMTGTLWHLVNDGTLHSKGTHFIDNALTQLDGDMDRIWDKVMK